jgi:hypothetical protein
VAARIPKPQAVPNAMAEGAAHGAAAVMKVQEESFASLLPNVSAAPVVIVAV